MPRHKALYLLGLCILNITVVEIALIFKIHHICVVKFLSFFLLDMSRLFVAHLSVALRAVKLAMVLEFGDGIIPFKLFAFRVKTNAKMNSGIFVRSFDLDLKHGGIWVKYAFLRKMAAA
jgi:hypothetical protein